MRLELCHTDAWTNWLNGVSYTSWISSRVQLVRGEVDSTAPCNTEGTWILDHGGWIDDLGDSSEDVTAADEVDGAAVEKALRPVNRAKSPTNLCKDIWKKGKKAFYRALLDFSIKKKARKREGKEKQFDIYEEHVRKMMDWI